LPDGLASGSGRILIRGAREIDALHLLFLGRQAESEHVREEYFGRSVLEIAEAMIASAEFHKHVLGHLLADGTLPHDERCAADLQLAAKVAGETGLTPLTLSDFGPEIHFAIDLAPFEDVAFVASAYRMILGREADPDGFETYCERLRTGIASKRGIAEELLASKEFRDAGRAIRIVWDERQDSAVLSGGDAILPFAWRPVLHRIFTQGPAGQILAERHGSEGERFVVALDSNPSRLQLHLSAPHPIGRVGEFPLVGRLLIEGWALARDGIAAIEIAVAGQRIGEVRRGLLRAEVAAACPNWPDSRNSGFAAILSSRELPAGARAAQILLRDTEGKTATVEIFFAAAESDLLLEADPCEHAALQRVLTGLNWHPLFCAMLVVGGDEEGIAAARSSLGALCEQSYPDWQAIIFVRGDGAPSAKLREQLLSGAYDIASLRGLVVGDGMDMANLRARLLDGFKKIVGRVEVVAGGGSAALADLVRRRAAGRPSYALLLMAGTVPGIDALLELAAASVLPGEAELISGGAGEEWELACLGEDVLRRAGASLDDLLQLGPRALAEHCAAQARAVRHIPLRLSRRAARQGEEEGGEFAAEPAAGDDGNLILHIDIPQFIDDSAEIPIRSTLRIEGWAVARDGAASIDIEIDGRHLRMAQYGLRRDDVAAAYPDWDDTQNSGFTVSIPRRQLPGGRHAIRIVLRDNSGREKAVAFLIDVGESAEDDLLSPRRKMSQAEIALNDHILTGLRWRPTFCLLVLVGRGEAQIRRARSTVAALREQAYSDWRALIIPPGPEVAAILRDELCAGFGEARDQVTIGEDLPALAECLAQQPVPGLLGVLSAGDELGCDALLEFALTSGMNRDADFFYSDELRISPVSRVVEPFLKPQWSPDLLLSTNYIGRLWCARSELIARASATIDELIWPGEYDLVLRLTENARAIRHIPRVLCRRADERIGGDPKERRALERAIARRGIAGEVLATRVPGTYRLRRKATKLGLVSIIICTCAARGLIKKCLGTLRALTAYREFEIIIVENVPPTEAHWKEWLRANADRVIAPDEPFNWSRFNNLGAAAASGEYLLFLNDDIEIIEPDWLNALLEHAQRPEVGVVGPMLLWPDRTVQSAGLFLIADVGRGRHAFRNLPENDPGYFGLALTQRNAIGVLGACLLTRKKAFERLGRFDEGHSVVNNELDYCLKAWRAGLLNIFTPYSKLIHHERASRNHLADDYDAAGFAEQWRGVYADGDPYHHPHLSKDSDHFVPEPEPLRLICPGRPLLRREVVRSILVVKLDHIGDCITAFAAVRRLKKVFPHASLRVLASHWTKPVWSLTEGVDEIIEFDFFHNRADQGIRDLTEAALQSLGQRLAPYHFDIAVDMRRHPETRHILQYTGARYLAGFDHKARFPWLDIALEFTGDPARSPKRHHVSDELVNLVDAISASCEPERSFGAELPPGSLPLPESIQHWLFCRRVVCIHAAAGDKLRQWPPAHFAELIDLLVEREDVNIVLIGGRGDREIASKILQRVRNRHAVSNLLGKISLEDLPNLMRRCALFVGNNSGPHHLAAGLGIPTIGVHSALIDSREWGPMGPRAVALRRDMECGPCYLSDPALCHRGLACLTGLQPGEVYAFCRRLLAIGYAGPPEGEVTDPRQRPTQM
jgi:ADP-heptose:LPS heptosyltransferase/GT2 family glycosyltransferase